MPKAQTHADLNTENSTYAQDIQKIQDIIDKLSQKDCDIDEMLRDVEEATSLIEKCQKKLGDTGIKIDLALKRLEDTNKELDN